MSDIRWPEKYLPGATDNYVSNEVIIAASRREVCGLTLIAWSAL